jgi:hypothetical protein
MCQGVLFLVVAALLMLPAGWIIVSKLTRSSQLAAGDGDWKFVQVRRLVVYIEASLDPNLQWVVFEPSGELVQGARLLPLCRKVPS